MGAALGGDDHVVVAVAAVDQRRRCAARPTCGPWSSAAATGRRLPVVTLLAVGLAVALDVFLAEEHERTHSDGPRPYDEHHVRRLRRLAVLISAVVLMAGCGGATTSHHQPTSPRPWPRRQRSIPRSRPRRSSAASPPARAMRRCRSSCTTSSPRRRPARRIPELWVAPGRSRRRCARSSAPATTRHARRRLATPGTADGTCRPSRSSSPSTTATAVSPCDARRALHRLGWPGVLNLELDNVRLKGGLKRAAGGRDAAATAGRSTPTRSPTPTSRRSTPRGCSARWRARARGCAALRGPRRLLRLPRRALRRTRRGGGARRGLRRGDDDRAGSRRCTTTRYALPRLRVTPQMTPADVVALAHG